MSLNLKTSITRMSCLARRLTALNPSVSSEITSMASFEIDQNFRFNKSDKLPDISLYIKDETE